MSTNPKEVDWDYIYERNRKIWLGLEDPEESVEGGDTNANEVETFSDERKGMPFNDANYVADLKMAGIQSTASPMAQGSNDSPTDYKFRQTINKYIEELTPAHESIPTNRQLNYQGLMYIDDKSIDHESSHPAQTAPPADLDTSPPSNREPPDSANTDNQITSDTSEYDASRGPVSSQNTDPSH